MHFRHMKKILTLSFSVMWLSGCVAPVEQVQQAQKDSDITVKETRSTEKNMPVTEYVCDKDKIVRVQTPKTPKNKTITVTFNQASHKLSSTVVQHGKKYSNIRWVWHEQNGKCTLRDNRNNVLAENCVKKQ
ncbi:MliC family protein [Glaesserella sp.]|uniref:MliC family protein n=1 Tax=Glaesserella sp. TaxID=2094731 RepID=UPI00359FAE2F